MINQKSVLQKNEQSFDHPFAKGIQGAPGVGFRLTSSGDYDMINKKLRNVGAPESNTDAATKNMLMIIPVDHPQQHG